LFATEAAAAAAAPPTILWTIPPTIPIAAFAALPAFEMARASPDGHQLAAVTIEKGISRVVVMSADDPAARPLVFRIGEPTVTDLRWAANGRLLARVMSSVTIFGTTVPLDRLFILDIATRKITIADRKSRGILGGDLLFVDRAGTYALLASQNDIFSTPSIKRIDLSSGEATLVEKAKDDVWDWFADGNGLVRGGIAYTDRRWTLWYRDQPGQPLQKTRGKFNQQEGSSVDRMVFGTSSQSPVVITNEKSDRFGAYEYDVKTGEIGKLLFESPTADLNDVVIDSATRSVIGVQYHDDRQRTFWFDAPLKTLQTKLDRALPGRVNEIIDPSNENRLFIRSGSASNPGSYYLIDRKTLQMK